MTEERYRLIGSTASPYAIKLRALLRYRRIPFDWVIMTKALRTATAHLRPTRFRCCNIPTHVSAARPRAGLRSGSRHRERPGRSRRHSRRLRVRSAGGSRRRMGGQTTVPVSLVGSGGSGLCLALGRRGVVDVGGRRPAAREEIEEFPQRQISRMVILGATAENRPLLEESYREDVWPHSSRMSAWTTICSAAGRRSPICLVRPAQRDGDRSDADADHAATRAVHRPLGTTAGRCLGVEGDWYPREQAFGGMVEALLKITGGLLPFLAANADAFAKGLERLEIVVWGLPYALAPFKYQVKCLRQLREKFAALNGGITCWVAAGAGAHRLLATSGCELTGHRSRMSDRRPAPAWRPV